jgi:predicted ATPase
LKILRFPTHSSRSFVHCPVARELFTPQLALPPGNGDPGDLYIVEENGRNIVYILDFMQSQFPELYQKLEEDVYWLLNYVERLETKHSERELSLVLRERAHGGLEAPSISAGTARLIAILTAFYALDMETTPIPSSNGRQFEQWNIPINQMPGLVVIEEPDTALNPGLLRNFVEQLRYFVTGEYPRQVILTTHNPALLDHFEPEEVRVVERDEQGDTHVNKLPEGIRKRWLDQYGLGEVWQTNAFGGMS